ncbi:MAG: alkaline phosphatase D family protein [Akkermansiaceae bacterium]|nr:alkaline phosphatase D family protein [Akkermansiaceae bacterium]
MKKFLLLLSILPSFGEEPVTRLACGSCYKPERDNGIFKVISADKPQAFLFMGDNIYADTSDPKVMKEKYRLLNIQPDYAAFSKSVLILPIWDDHDYGLNDAGREFEMKETSAKLFFEAFNFPAEHEVRKTPGVYHSRIMGPEGKRLQIIMLDTRYFRSPLVKVKEGKRKVYVPQTGPEATILGEVQWKWLTSELKKPAELRIIVSSIQIINNKHRFEKWANMPDERKKFLELLRTSKSGPTILLSGDRHLGEVCQISHHFSHLPFELYEMTTSGMTHAGAPDDPSLHRVPGTYTRAINYGLIDIDWTNKKPSATLSVKNLQGKAESLTFADFNQQLTVK